LYFYKYIEEILKIVEKEPCYDRLRLQPITCFVNKQERVVFLHTVNELLSHWENKKNICLYYERSKHKNLIIKTLEELKKNPQIIKLWQELFLKNISIDKFNCEIKYLISLRIQSVS